MFAVMSITVFLLSYIVLNSATTGIDLSTVCGSMSCIKSSSMDFTIPRAWKSYGAFDSTSITNLNYAWNAGIPYNDVYLFPCRSMSATTQVDDLIADLANGLNATANQRKPRHEIFHHNMNVSKLIKNRHFTNNNIPEWRKDVLHNYNSPDVKYGMIWMDIESNPSSGCGWGTNYASNCDYLQELLSAAVAKGAKPGVYSSLGEWENVMGSRSACTTSAVSKYPLWYAHYDGVESFSDWSSMQFGGWTSPAMKQFKGTTTLCGCGVDETWY